MRWSIGPMVVGLVFGLAGAPAGGGRVRAGEWLAATSTSTRPTRTTPGAARRTRTPARGGLHARASGRQPDRPRGHPRARLHGDHRSQRRASAVRSRLRHERRDRRPRATRTRSTATRRCSARPTCSSKTGREPPTSSRCQRQPLRERSGRTAVPSRSTIRSTRRTGDELDWSSTIRSSRTPSRSGTSRGSTSSRSRPRPTTTPRSASGRSSSTPATGWPRPAGPTTITCATAALAGRRPADDLGLRRGALCGRGARGSARATPSSPRQPPNARRPSLFLEADADGDGNFESMVGDSLTAPSPIPVRVRIENALPGTSVRVVSDLEVKEELALTAEWRAAIAADKWIRAELRRTDLRAERRAACDPLLGGQTTYCRNGLFVEALTSPIYVTAPMSAAPGRACMLPSKLAALCVGLTALAFSAWPAAAGDVELDPVEIGAVAASTTIKAPAGPRLTGPGAIFKVGAARASLHPTPAAFGGTTWQTNGCTLLRCRRVRQHRPDAPPARPVPGPPGAARGPARLAGVVAGLRLPRWLRDRSRPPRGTVGNGGVWVRAIAISNGEKTFVYEIAEPSVGSPATTRRCATTAGSSMCASGSPRTSACRRERDRRLDPHPRRRRHLRWLGRHPRLVQQADCATRPIAAAKQAIANLRPATSGRRDRSRNAQQRAARHLLLQRRHGRQPGSRHVVPGSRKVDRDRRDVRRHTRRSSVTPILHADWPGAAARRFEAVGAGWD